MPTGHVASVLPLAKGMVTMTARSSKTNTTPDVSTATPDDYRAFADFLAAGNTGSFADWFASPAGEAQRVAFADQAKAAARKNLMSASRAVWRDFKQNGQLTTYSVAKLRELMAHVATLDLDSLPEPTDTTTDADDATDGDATTDSTTTE